MRRLHFALERTRLGALVRAGVDDRATAETLGIDIAKVFALVFGIGTYLAGVAGVVAAPCSASIPAWT
jgi:branched-chain amino acid transport system permease protein